MLPCSQLPAETSVNGCSVSLTRVTNAMPAVTAVVSDNHQRTASRTVHPQHPTSTDALSKLRSGTMLLRSAAEFFVVRVYDCFLAV